MASRMLFHILSSSLTQEITFKPNKTRTLLEEISILTHDPNSKEPQTTTNILRRTICRPPLFPVASHDY